MYIVAVLRTWHMLTHLPLSQLCEVDATVPFQMGKLRQKAFKECAQEQRAEVEPRRGALPPLICLLGLSWGRGSGDG